VKQVHVKRAPKTRVCNHLLMLLPVLLDLRRDPPLRRERRASSSLTIFLILPNTQRSEKLLE
jgi:hypothetical protein